MPTVNVIIESGLTILIGCAARVVSTLSVCSTRIQVHFVWLTC